MGYKPYFASDCNWKQFREELFSWEGTPYRHFTMVKGRGADCALFILAAWKEVGVMLDVKYEYYPSDWHKHTDEDFISNGIIRHVSDHSAEGLTLLTLPPDVHWIQGDWLGFSVGKNGVSNHCGIVLEDLKTMIHSIKHRGVSTMLLGKWWRQRANNLFRVVWQ